ncbi:MAG: hypothetical protein ACKVPX_02170 [Myxococcaceae bacterium]
MVLIVLAIAGGGAYWYWDKSKTEQAAKDATGPKAAITGAKGKGKAGFDPNRATPVVGEAAKKGEINVYLNGLGTKG